MISWRPIPIEPFQPKPHVETSGEIPSLDGVRVLVVDDDPDSRSFLSALLEKQGATVGDGRIDRRGARCLQAARPDVLVSDIAMPRQDGYDLIRIVRALPARDGGRTPAVALTAYVRAEDADAALAAGYQRHLRKPVVISDLIVAVAALAAAGATATGGE